MPGCNLIAHWPLNGNAEDSVGQNHGWTRDIEFVAGPAGVDGTAARFNGRDSLVEVPDAEPLRLGNRDFSISSWVRCEQPMRGVFGDILSKFDPSGRSGLNFSIAGSSPAYNGMSDTRHVHFGIDDGYLSSWEDCGQPWPSNSLVPCLIVYEGELYCGTADASNPTDACRVLKWTGGTEWTDCGRLGSDPDHLSVQAMIVHDGKLYAGTGVWDWVKAHGAVEGFQPALSHVFVYEGGTEWRDLGQVGEGVRVLCMGSFDGGLYSGLDAEGGGR